jgi:pyruvate formate lyase activating enzyme
LQDIKQRADLEWIDAVCITGGEPTLNPHLPLFLEKIKQQEVKIRLETNGSNPFMIKQLIQEKLIDSIALDIKNSKNKYSETTGVEINPNNIKKTLQIIKNSKLDYELRTTIVPGLHEKEDILNIVEWLNKIFNSKIKLYVLQQFRSDLPQQKTLNTEFQKKENYPLKKLKDIKKDIENTGYFEKVEIRGQ